MEINQMQVVVGTVAKEHDMLFEDIINNRFSNDVDIQHMHTVEGSLRTFLLEARDKGFNVEGIYTLDYKINKLCGVTL